MNMLNGKQIREVREMLKMSPTGFAAHLGVSENTVRRWEIGDRHPRWEMMERINKIADDARSSQEEAAHA